MTIKVGDNVRFTGELDPEWDGLGYSDTGRVVRLFEQCGERYATAAFPAADERAGCDMVTRSHLVSELVVTPAAPVTYAVELTGAQIFSFSDLIRRLTRADVERPLRHELAAALMTFEALLPEPSEEDGDAYLVAVRAGELPAWSMDLLPLTGTHSELEEAALAADGGEG